MKLSIKIEAPDWGPTQMLREEQWRRDAFAAELRIIVDRLVNSGIEEGARSYEREVEIDGVSHTIKVSCYFERGAGEEERS